MPKCRLVDSVTMGGIIIAFFFTVMVGLKPNLFQPDSLFLGWAGYARFSAYLVKQRQLYCGGLVGAILVIFLQRQLKKQKRGTNDGQSCGSKASDSKWKFTTSGPYWSFEASGTGGKLSTEDDPASTCPKNNDSIDTGESGSGNS